MSTELPSIGRIVHYTMYGAGGKTYVAPAMITQVDDDWLVHLCVFDAYSTTTQHRVGQATEPTVGRWHWPPRAG